MGYGNFDNDDAADWVAELEDARTIHPVISALQRANAEDYLEAPESCVALVAAEVVAAIRGNQRPDFPRKWRAG